MGTMSSSKLQVGRGNAPMESRPFVDKGRAELHKLGDAVVMRGVFEPGWKWSQHIGPIAGTPSCQARHFGFVLAGRMRIRMDDGTEEEVGPGDFMRIAPGHDAWVVGNEACVVIDFGGTEEYAKRMAETLKGKPQAQAEAPRPR